MSNPTRTAAKGRNNKHLGKVRGHAKFGLSGGGTITRTSSTPLTVQKFVATGRGRLLWTAEDTNSTDGLLPPGPSTSFTQTFGVT